MKESTEAYAAQEREMKAWMDSCPRKVVVLPLVDDVLTFIRVFFSRKRAEHFYLLVADEAKNEGADLCQHRDVSSKDEE